jgi:hypothetical protein
MVFCGGANNIPFNVTLTPVLSLDCQPTIGDTTNYTYTWGGWSSQQPNGPECGGLEQMNAVEECPAGLGCCINQKDTVQVRAQTPCPTKAGDFPHVMLSGIPLSCNVDGVGWLDGLWQYVGTTADDRPYYKFWSPLNGGEWHYMYYEEKCNGNARSLWVIARRKPNTTRERDLDGDGKCSYTGMTIFFTDSFAAPSGEWTLRGCESNGGIALIITPECQTTTNYTYTWGDWIPEQPNGPSCGEREKREGEEQECAAGFGCCINQQKTSQVRTQVPCPTKAGDYAQFTLSGSACFSSFYGLWQYVGTTADKRPYYRFWLQQGTDGKWVYMYYDKNCQRDVGGKSWWIIGDEPDTAAEHDLDGRGDNSKCTHFGHTTQSETSKTPPSGAWEGSCGGDMVSLNLTIVPNCPNYTYTYTWGAWQPQQTDGTICGQLDQRDAKEDCAAPDDCNGCTVLVSRQNHLCPRLFSFRSHTRLV